MCTKQPLTRERYFDQLQIVAKVLIGLWLLSITLVPELYGDIWTIWKVVLVFMGFRYLKVWKGEGYTLENGSRRRCGRRSAAKDSGEGLV